MSIEIGRTLNPGSNEAIKAGCLCPVLENAHGLGYMGDPKTYVINAACTIHGLPFLRENLR